MYKCKICLELINIKNKNIISPCNCKQEYKYIHEYCLYKFILSTNNNNFKKSCFICLEDYKYEYKESNIQKKINYFINIIFNRFNYFLIINYLILLFNYLIINNNFCKKDIIIFDNVLLNLGNFCQTLNYCIYDLILGYIFIIQKLFLNKYKNYFLFIIKNKNFIKYLILLYLLKIILIFIFYYISPIILSFFYYKLIITLKELIEIEKILNKKIINNNTEK